MKTCKVCGCEITDTIDCGDHEYDWCGMCGDVGYLRRKKPMRLSGRGLKVDYKNAILKKVPRQS